MNKSLIPTGTRNGTKSSMWVLCISFGLINQGMIYEPKYLNFNFDAICRMMANICSVAVCRHSNILCA